MGNDLRTTRVPPGAGEHTREILAELGYGDEQIAALVADGIVVEGPVNR